MAANPAQYSCYSNTQFAAAKAEPSLHAHASRGLSQRRYHRKAMGVAAVCRRIRRSAALHRLSADPARGRPARGDLRTRLGYRPLCSATPDLRRANRRRIARHRAPDRQPVREHGQLPRVHVSVAALFCRRQLFRDCAEVGEAASGVVFPAARPSALRSRVPSPCSNVLGRFAPETNRTSWRKTSSRQSSRSMSPAWAIPAAVTGIRSTPKTCSLRLEGRRKPERSNRSSEALRLSASVTAPGIGRQFPSIR